MKLIAAVDQNWAIGNQGQLLVSIPEDQRRFRLETTGKVIVMGRKTLESLPGRRPLDGRTNLILSRTKGYLVRGAEVFGSLESLMERLSGCRPEDVYVIGGQSIYQQFLPYCQEAQITWIDYVYHGDTYCPDFDKLADWQMESCGEELTYFDLCYEFRRYVRKK